MALPKTIYVYEGSDGVNKFLEAFTKPDDTVDLGEKRTIGIYELKERAVVSATIKTTIIKKKGR